LLPRTIRLLLPGLLGPLLLSLLLRLPLLLLPLLHLRLLPTLLLLLRLLSPLLLPLLHLRLLPPLLLPRLLGPLLLLLLLLRRLSARLVLRPRLILRSARLLPLRFCLYTWLGALLFPTARLLALLAFRFRLFPILLVVLRVRDARPDKQEKGGGAGSSNEIHDDRLL
jgi:hypothetical protein